MSTNGLVDNYIILR